MYVSLACALLHSPAPVMMARPVHAVGECSMWVKCLTTSVTIFYLAHCLGKGFRKVQINHIHSHWQNVLYKEGNSHLRAPSWKICQCADNNHWMLPVISQVMHEQVWALQLQLCPWSQSELAVEELKIGGYAGLRNFPPLGPTAWGNRTHCSANHIFCFIRLGQKRPAISPLTSSECSLLSS